MSDSESSERESKVPRAQRLELANLESSQNWEHLEEPITTSEEPVQSAAMIDEGTESDDYEKDSAVPSYIPKAKSFLASLNAGKLPQTQVGFEL